MPLTLILRIAKFYSTEFLVYPVETLALIVRRVAIVGLLLLFWHLVSQDNPVQSVQIVPYILIASGVQFFTLGHNFRQAGDIHFDIKEGRLNNLLVRPLNELHYEFGMYIGKNLIEFVFSIINIILGFVFLSGFSAAQMGLFAISLIPAFLVGYALNIIVAAIAFWVIDASYIRLVTYFILRVITGLYIPLTFFGPVWSWVLQLLPFAQAGFVPSYTLTGTDTQLAVILVAAGFGHSIVMLYLARHIWRRGLIRYGAVGI